MPDRNDMCSIQIHNLKSCCGCLSLRTGCFVVPVAQLIVLILADSLMLLVPPIATYIINLVVLSTIGYLIYGTVKKNHAHLRRWLIIDKVFIVIVAVVICLCLFAAIFIKLSDSRRHASHVEFTLFLISAVVGVAILTMKGFLAWIVHSYICELREQEERENRNGNNIGGPEMNALAPVSV